LQQPGYKTTHLKPYSDGSHVVILASQSNVIPDFKDLRSVADRPQLSSKTTTSAPEYVSTGWHQLNLRSFF
jgi:hypothetical protein